MDCPEPPTNPPDDTPGRPWPLSPLRHSYLWEPMEWEESCAECHSCSHCVTGGVEWVEASNEYLCEKCTEMKESD